MAEQANAPQKASQPRDAPPPRPKKIFGVMTKRRWFGVIVFLSAMLWSYTAGPPLADTIVCNRYFVDGMFYDPQTVRFEGNISLIDKLFKRGFWPDVFIWQIGSYFGFTEGPVWSDKYSQLLFTDLMQNHLFSWSPINGVQIELENAGQADDAQLAQLKLPGANGMLQHPSNPDLVFMAQHAQRRIVLYNLHTKQIEKTIADQYKGQKLNSPNDMALGPKREYLYFTDPPYGLVDRFDAKDPNFLYADKKSQLGFNGIYRVKIDGASKVELLDKSMRRPNGIVFSSDYSRLFVSDSISGEFRLNVFDFDAKSGAIKLNEVWDEARILRHNDKLESKVSSLKGGVGSVDGMTLIDDTYLMTTCPGGKLCVIRQKSGDLEALIKLPDKVHLSNVAVGGDANLYVTGNHTVWQIKLQS